MDKVIAYVRGKKQHIAMLALVGLLLIFGPGPNGELEVDFGLTYDQAIASIVAFGTSFIRAKFDRVFAG